ncbi:putative RecQ family helicase RecQ [Aspergillus brunneoviolaceus CBS 621.78]|uniref:ATP-dependent DNA helicase n=1 Tax=Aspergillus brunneoviolaceus CBS 621.78 TaxID=1450534 RepID=A0ACD1FXC8_9EURO|nr:ATP-dependent DNA helicase [Aspergillus brunneoviolaceus CBS 621.78]RAH41617.1 ATP-dependent DNA helicase [Aspergillus brunneoviolaceus CBS 621.78]
MVSGGLQRRKVDLDFYLRRVFRKNSFRPLQRDVITAAVEGHDVFLQANTSFGKSLCFQLPAVTSHGVTVVICPLLALMTDQVKALQAIGVAVATINSTTPISERRVILDDLLSGHPRTRLLYVTPELCQTETFRRNLQTIHSQGELIRIAIDEAHCISEWGHDFRSAYKELGWFRRALSNPPVPISALTATATPRVRADIIKLLGLDPLRLRIFNTPSARPNIHYEVRYLDDFASDPTEPEDFQIRDFVAWLQAVQARREARLGAGEAAKLPPVSGIIYVPLRAVSDKLASALSRAWDGRIHAVAYHAGLSSEERTRIQTEWTSTQPVSLSRSRSDGKPPPIPPAFYLIVATTAFGMGIDSPHVRFVIHWSPPRSFEGFVQESGRAGRDGRAAASIVYYNTQERDRILDRLQRDVENARNRTGGPINSGSGNNNRTNSTVQNQFARLASFQKVIGYCETTTRCRHEMIKDFFGDLELEKMGSQAPSSSTQMMNPTTTTSSPCDLACDFCKEGSQGVAKRKARMAPESHADDFVDMNHVPWYMQKMFPEMFPGYRDFGDY